MLKTSVCDYGNAYVLGIGRITIDEAGAGDTRKQTDKIEKEVIFKN